jgi:hypothetical protein
VKTLRSGLTLVAHAASWIESEVRGETYGFGRSFDFNKAHSAVSSNAESFVEAEPWDLDATEKER